MRILAASFLVLGFVLSSCATIEQSVKTGVQTTRIFNAAPYSHLRYLPKNYSANSNTDFPVLIFLHGSGERGTDIEVVKKHGPPKLINEGRDLPFITISPQLEEGASWNSARLEATLLEATKGLKIDKSRIYLTGLSLGGFGTWSWAQARPNLFAAIAPIAGFSQTDKACTIKDLPIWAFHGAKDDAVPLAGSADIVKAIEVCGGKPKFTIYPEEGHWSWVPAYNNPELYTWMLSQKNPNGASEFAKLK